MIEIIKEKSISRPCVYLIGINTRTTNGINYLWEGIATIRSNSYFDFTLLGCDKGFIIGATVYDDRILQKRKLEFPKIV